MTTVSAELKVNTIPSRPSAETSRLNETFPPTFNYSQSVLKEKQHDHIEHTHIETWENEGGAHSDLAGSGLGRSRLSSMSFLNSHIDMAEQLIGSGQYDEACHELEAAADRFEEYRNKINASFDASIAHLTTKGCRATPPDPRALKLIRLRRKLTT